MVSELVREAESQTPVAVIHYKRVDVNALQVTREKSVNLELIKNAINRNEFDLEIELDNLLDRNRESSLFMELFEKRFRSNP